MNDIVIASNNKGKLREFSQMLAPFNLNARPMHDFDLPSPEETGLTFVENAILKARHAAAATQLPGIADDSGLEVDALNGAPGIYSGRFAGEGASDTDNLQKLIALLHDTPEKCRTARYQAVIIYLKHETDSTPIIAQGTLEGRIILTPRGNNGFGYDPVFYLEDYTATAAELAPEVKNSISHRGQAMQSLLMQLNRH